MQKLFAAWAVLAALSLAGCSGDDDGHHHAEAVTCPDGTVMSAEEVEQAMEEHKAGEHDHHHMESADNGTGDIAAQVCIVPPSVTLEGLPATLQAFKQASFRWSLDNGSIAHAHSMLTSIRYSPTSVPDSDLTEVTKYPSELIKREHQNLPVAYSGNLSFSKVGTVYIRAYAEIQGEPYWSDEVMLQVTEVAPTGTVHTVTHGPGLFASPVTPSSVSAVLGDAVQLDNQDAVPYTCSFDKGPAQVDALTAESMQMSNIVLLVVPGSYTFVCDEPVQPSGFTVDVALA
jgi:hypothetical protein